MARNGDWFIAPCQCEQIWFVNVCWRLPRRPSIGDTHTLKVLRKGRRDVGTITKKSYRPVGDKVGMGVAIQMMEK